MPNWKFEWFDRVDRVGEAVDGQSIATGTTTRVNLSAPPFKVMFRSFTGDAPPFIPINQNVPLTPGSYLKFVDTEENEVDLMLLIQGSSREALYNIMAGSATNGVSLPYLFNPVKREILATLRTPPAKPDAQRLLTGFGKLRVTTPANSPQQNTVRDLICRCISGFKIRESDLQIKSAFVPLTFYANQPYWRKADRNTFDLGPMVFPPSADPVPPPWFAFLDSVTMGAGVEYEKKFNVFNFGDVSTPPIWTVFGPGAAPYFELLQPNQVPGQGQILSFGPNCRIGKKQSLVINVENRTAQISGGTSVLNTINVNSQFWELLTDLNRVTVRLSDGPSGYVVDNNTHVKIEYYERFLGAY
jgi:hypothetical protein